MPKDTERSALKAGTVCPAGLPGVEGPPGYSGPWRRWNDCRLVNDVQVTDRECLQRIVAEKQFAFIEQATVAHGELIAAKVEDAYWGDRIFTFVAVLHAKRAAELGLEVLALQRALSDSQIN